jgi:dTDP-4-dehydrorhamnose 3,5-epimerase-like enzyme
MIINEHKVLGDHRGKLVAIESDKDIPFEIKRVFHIYGTQANVPRGNHSHYKTKQYIFAINGRCKVTLDDGEKTTIYELDQPNKGLFQAELVWGTMHDFSDDCVLLVLASEHYDETDYIREYKEFMEYLNVTGI